MSRRVKLGALALGGALVVGGAFYALRRSDSSADRRTAGGAGIPSFTSRNGEGNEAASPAATAPPPREPVGREKAAKLMSLWRNAIISHDAEMVLFCDQAFLDDRAVSMPALVESAQTDANDTVRAFSTRMLGKFRDPALVSVFRHLLSDGHSYVRENAAWALGELSSRDAIKELEKLRKRDSAENVRKSAAEALDKVRGRSTPPVRKG